VTAAERPSSDDGDEEGASALRRVRAALLATGATEAEIDDALANGVIDLLTLDHLLVPAARRYSIRALSERTGVALELLRRLWRALGFLDVDDDAVAFTDLDLVAVEQFSTLLQIGSADVDTGLQMARVIGQSMARIAEAELVAGVMSVSAEPGSVEAAAGAVRLADTWAPAMASLIEFAWRRHLQAATRHMMLLRSHGMRGGASPTMVVGFADMVGFTLLSQHLDSVDLAAVVRRFEEISHDLVTSLGGRVVKMIGDEAMFVVDDVVAAARIGLGLAEAYADDDLLSDVRVGMAIGPVLVSDGDYYGPPVNLASRIVKIANPGTVLVSDEFHQLLERESNGEFSGQPLKPRTLKDLGTLQLWWCGRPGEVVDGTGRRSDRRRHRRWERLSNVGRSPSASPLGDAGGGDAEGA